MNKTFTLLFTLFLFIQSINSQPVSQTYTSAGTYTYTVPAGYTANVTIHAWGAGGGGGTNTSGAKGGGCGGAYASSSSLLNAGTYTIIVGAGGAPGIAGGNSSFTTLVIADGGGSTSSTQGGVAGSSTGSTGSTTILANNGASAIGNNGGAGGNAANGGGAGGTGGIANNGSGINGIAPGGGGGGKAGPGIGGTSGNGADGRVIVSINSVLIILPVKFTNIKAVEKQQSIQIEWNTEAENSITKYFVERSADGISFASIGQVNANNVSMVNHYEFLDALPLSAVNYYRIKSVDINNRITYSSILKLQPGRNSDLFTVYPNPVLSNTVFLQSGYLAKGDYFIQLVNNTGHVLYKQTLQHGGGAISMSIQLPENIFPGVYAIQLKDRKKTWMNKQLLLQ